jgi:hypothetical protein
MAAAAYTGSLPVHPGASTACYWLVLHACSHPTSTASVGGPPGTRMTRTCCPPGPQTLAGRAPAHTAWEGARRPAEASLPPSVALLQSMSLLLTALALIAAHHTPTAVTAAE